MSMPIENRIVGSGMCGVARSFRIVCYEDLTTIKHNCAVGRVVGKCEVSIGILCASSQGGLRCVIVAKNAVKRKWRTGKVVGRRRCDEVATVDTIVGTVLSSALQRPMQSANIVMRV